MYNQILWTLDNETDGKTFERLCTDLLTREGYADLIPIGDTHDRGRDAQIQNFLGLRGLDNENTTFFQYSLEEKWEAKLNKELEKVRRNNHQISNFVFVTRGKVTGNKRDKLERLVATKYGWQLIIYDREWLRNRLEERYPDLAAKYLGVPLPASQLRPTAQDFLPVSSSPQNKSVWVLLAEDKCEEAAIEFKRILRENGENLEVRQALTYCQYRLFHYQEALETINFALAADENNERSLSLKACILTESGIEQGSRANLLIACDLFQKLTSTSKRWVDHYNFGNALKALGYYKAAAQEYLYANKLKPDQAEVWVNLGITYFQLHRHQKEIKCYDQALAINPLHSQALASKGLTLLIAFRDVPGSILLLKQAIAIDPSILAQWPNGYYWLGQAYFQNDNLHEALSQANSGVATNPGNQGLLDLKARILKKLWRKDACYTGEALAFFQFRVQLSSYDYESYSELVRLYWSLGEEQKAFSLVADLVGLDEDELVILFQAVEISLDSFLDSLEYLLPYKKFRAVKQVSEYAKMLAEHDIPVDPHFEKHLWSLCLVSFGQACEKLSRLPQGKRAKELVYVFWAIQGFLGLSLPKIGARLFTKPNSQAELIQTITELILIWPDIALYELSRQFGFLGSIFGLPHEVVDQIVKDQGPGLAHWQANVAAETFGEIDKIHHLKG